MPARGPLALCLALLLAPSFAKAQSSRDIHREAPDDAPAEPTGAQATNPEGQTQAGVPPSVQVNVDGGGGNIGGDAANEPSLAVDPRDGRRMAIGWRQFDSVSSNFRQAGVAFSDDGGRSWHDSGPLDRGNFRSDPVLAADGDGTFYYYSLTGTAEFACDLFKSGDGGASWASPVAAFGGDKAWMAIDRTGGSGRGHVYVSWSIFAGCCDNRTFIRSRDRGATFDGPIEVPGNPIFGTVAVAPDGLVYVVGVEPNTFASFVVARSASARDAGAPLAFEQATGVDLGGAMVVGGGPNPQGLLGQAWVAVGPGGQVYVLCSVDPPGEDPLDVMLVRSLDGGATFGAPVRVNDVQAGWQWFGTMSVAPGGRIDVIWNDTRDDPGGARSQLRYASSFDGGASFGASAALSAPFEHFVGYPNQSKLGDYYDMVSDDGGASIAYAATFNGEQDVYFLRVNGDPGFDPDVDGNGLVDGRDLIRLAFAFGAADGDPRYDERADIDGSGAVDGNDLALLVAAFGRGAA